MARIKNLIRSLNDYTLTALAVAEFFGVSDRTVRNWRDDGMPRSSSSKYNLGECFVWWQENINKAGSEKEEKSRERYWDAKARREELQVKKLEESVLDKAELEQVWCDRLTEVVRGLEAQEHILPALLENAKAPQIRKRIVEYNNKLRANYARYGKYTPVESVAGINLEKKKPLKKPRPKKPAANKAGKK